MSTTGSTPPRSAPGGRLKRRDVLAILAGSLAVPSAASIVAPEQAQAAVPTPTPKLPGEYSRKNNQVTSTAGTLYDNIVVKIKGDSARLYIPQTVLPNVGQPVRVVWFYHGAGSDHNALDGGFKVHAELVIDQGAIAICQNAGGTLYSHPTAQAIQVSGYAWMAALYVVRANVLRATSGGGGLACETYGSKLIPNIAGIYNVNAVYDIMALYNGEDRDRLSVIAAFGDDPVAIQAANPARLPASAWAGDNLRVVYSQPDSSDRTVPPEQHGKKLIELTTPVAAEASVRTHTNGHNTPGFVKTDFIVALERWAPKGILDVTPPVVQIVSPATGSTAKGALLLTATASDASGVAGVKFALEPGSRTLTATQTSDGWQAQLDTTSLPDGTYNVTASATDVVGNTGTSSPISLIVLNADTTPPVVQIVSPAAGSTATGTLLLTATASDAGGVAGVKFALEPGSRTLAATQTSDGWQAQLDTTSLPNGTYNVTAAATDATGNTGTSTPISLAVQNADTTAPVVRITSPTAGATVSGTVALTAVATDAVGVTAVSFYTGTRLIGNGSLSGGAWILNFDTKTRLSPNGVYPMTARALDASGNVGESAPVTITIRN